MNNIPSAKPYFSEDNIRAVTEDVREILSTGRLILGPYTKQLEDSFRDYIGVKYAVAVSSGSAALEIALRYFDVKGKEVIVPTNTFLATANAVMYAGGHPILADMNPETLCIDTNDLLRRITANTKGVIAVHVAGLPCPDMDEIRTICREKELFLMEDCAHAHGATIQGRKTGSLSDAGCFSFYPTKVMTTGTGGMITTNDEKLAAYAFSLRHHGVGQGLHDIIYLGSDWLMSEISAALGIYQLRALEDNIGRRNEIAQKYYEGLVNLEGVTPFIVPDNIRHVYYKYPFFLSPTINKYVFIKLMQDEYGVQLGSIYDPPCHLQPAYQRIFGYSRGMFPKAEETLERTCCLPMFVQMTSEEVDYVIQSLKLALNSFKKAPIVMEG